MIIYKFETEILSNEKDEILEKMLLVIENYIEMMHIWSILKNEKEIK